MLAILDTDALLGLVSTGDALHNKAVDTAQMMLNHRVDTAVLPTTLSEFATVATTRIGREQAQRTVAGLIDSGIVLIDITEKLSLQALAWYGKQTSRKDSLFDCYVMAASILLGANCIFSFDHGYEKNGFYLAREFLKNRPADQTT